MKSKISKDLYTSRYIILMTIFFSADQHYNHANINKYCSRGFKDVAYMNETLINNWNSIVSNEDTAWILGDFSMGKETPVERLNGKTINFIVGCHDSSWMGYQYNYNANKGYIKHGRIHFWGYMKILSIDKTKVILSHWPFKSWYASYHGSYNLYGHTHQKIQSDGNRSYNVGVDANNFYPVKWAKIKQSLKLKSIITK